MLHCEYSLPRSRLYRAAFRIDCTAKCEYSKAFWPVYSACSKSGERRHRRVLPCVNRLQEPARPMRHSRESGNLGRTDRRTPRLLLGGDPDWIPAYAGMTGETDGAVALPSEPLNRHLICCSAAHR